MKKKNTAKKGTFKKVLSYIKDYKLLLSISLIMGIITVCLSLYIPYLIGKSIDFIIDKGQVDLNSIIKTLLFTGICIAISALAQWFMNVINNKITYSVVRDVRKNAFDKIEILPLSYIDSHRTGETVSRIISDVDQFADGLLLGFSQLFTGILTIIGTLVFMLTINVPITFFVVFLTPISLFVASYIAKNTHNMFVLRASTTADQTAFIDESVTSEKIIKAFGTQDKKEKEFDNINEKLADCSLKAIFFSSITNPSTRFVNSLVYTTVALVGAFAVMGFNSGIFSVFKSITVGSLTTLLCYANQYTKPFNEISSVITEFQNALACASRIFEIIEETPETTDSPSAYVLSKPTGDLEIDNVNFSYSKDKKLIENLNLKVKQGEKVAIVGPTGCGKTTLINLLMRFYDTDSGEIKMSFTDNDGKEITAPTKEITKKSMRSAFGMVLQDTWLKAGTIRENILMGKPDATDEEMINAAKRAHSHSFIKRLPNGYDTVIGEDGGSLSGGQKQLLCITRIMLSLPSILILDEATSSIDTRTEQKIQSAFAELMEGRTSFVVAHRLSTIKSADTILVMKDGKVIEQGNDKELTERKGFYYELSLAGQYGNR